MSANPLDPTPELEEVDTVKALIESIRLNLNTARLYATDLHAAKAARYALEELDRLEPLVSGGGPWLSLAQAAARLGVGRSYVNERILRHEIAAERGPRGWRIALPEFKRFARTVARPY